MEKTGSLGIGVDVDTSQVEKAIGEIDELSESVADMAPQVTIRNCDNCTFNIYPSRTVVHEGVQLPEYGEV